MEQTGKSSERATTPHVVRNVCVMGAGYAGATTAAVLAYQNPSCQVNVVDINSGRIAAWKSEDLPIYEPGLKELLDEVRDAKVLFSESEYARSELPQQSLLNGTGANGVQNGSKVHRTPNLKFSTDIASGIREADVVFICVETPSHISPSNTEVVDIDLRRHDSALEMIAQHSVGPTIVVEKSTIPCGTSQRSQDFLRKYDQSKADFTVLSNAEYLAQGTSIYYLFYPDKVIIGFAQEDLASQAASEALATLYLPWVPQKRVITMSLFSAELSKLAHNGFLAQRISSVNSLSAICERDEADIADVTRALGMSSRLGPYFLGYSIGFGGSCLVKDTACLSHLAESYGLPEVAQYWKQVLLMNEYQKSRLAERILAPFGGQLEGERITVLGFGYKGETRDARGTPVREVILKLHSLGASVAIFDPQIPVSEIREQLRDRSADPKRPISLPDRVQIMESVYDACYKSKAIAILNNLADFEPGRPSNVPLLSKNTHTNGITTNAHIGEPIDWTWIAENMHEPRYIFNGRGTVDAKSFEEMGFIVDVIGRKSSLTSTATSQNTGNISSISGSPVKNGQSRKRKMENEDTADSNRTKKL